VNVSILLILTPGLQHISINLPRDDGSRPWEKLKSLTGMPELTTASFYFRLQSDCNMYGHSLGRCRRCGNGWQEFEEESWFTGSCEGLNQFASPLLDSSAALEMLTFMRANNVGEELKEIIFRAGDWVGPYDGPLPVEWFIDDRRITVNCSVVEGRDVCEEQKGGFGD
jgi:hypothetical protein